MGRGENFLNYVDKRWDVENEMRGRARKMRKNEIKTKCIIERGKERRRE